jgi:predicted transcriptional regulator
MELKELSLAKVAKRARIPYTTASELLTGTRVDQQRLNKLSAAIKSAPMPQEVAA